MSILDRVEVSKTVRAFLEKRRPQTASMRAKLDYGFHFHKQSVELIEIRPRMNDKPGKTEHAFAKATFVQSRGTWKVYWMRGNLKWHPHEPPTARSLAAFLKLVDADEHHCFFG
jgi:hypothetical protein